MENNLNFAGRREAKTKSIRFDIRKGKLSHYVGEDKPREEFDFVMGKLKGIAVRSRESAGGELTFMDIHMEKEGTRFTVSSLASGSVTAELMSKMCNIRDVNSEICIEVWPKGNYTNCTVRENGEKLPFRFLPKAIRKQVGFNTSIDSSERDAAVIEIIKELNVRLGYVQTV